MTLSIYNSGLYGAEAAFSLSKSPKKIIAIYYNRAILTLMEMEPEVGDKVRLRQRGGAPARGVVEEVRGDGLLIRLDESGQRVVVKSAQVTNFSLAARKAWKNMPYRRVGRPSGSRHCDRVSVTLRIDRELWEQFRQSETEGLITNRTATVNAWLREMLDRLVLTKEGEGATENHR
jgi:uncharacterized protein (DUF4415 family)